MSDAWMMGQPFDEFEDAYGLETLADLDAEQPGAFDELEELASPLGVDGTPHGWSPVGFETLQGYGGPLGLDDFDGLDDGFDLDPMTGLFLPNAGDTLITGAPALAIAQSLNPFVVDALGADDADAFFKRIARRIRRFAGGALRLAGRVARQAGRIAGRVGRAAAPLLRRALPMIQKLASMAGPWGRVVAAGLGAAQGLLAGKGLRGALAGALSGAIPGIGGKLASAVLRGDGADDDAALDALADMADAGFVPAAVAMPAGAGLAVRVAARNGTGIIQRNAQPTERWLLRVAFGVRGSPGQRLRILRAIGRVAAELLRRRGQAALVRGALVSAAHAATRIVLTRIRGQALAGASSPAAAGRRLSARRVVLANIPVGTVFDRYPALAVA